MNTEAQKHRVFNMYNMRNCYLSRNYKNMRSAGSKAKTDMERIWAEEGFVNLGLAQTRSDNKVYSFFRTLASVCAMCFHIRRGDVLFLQYPFKKYFAFVCHVAHRRGARVVTLIHDLGSFRRKKLTVPQEIARLSHADALITLNDAMADWLRAQGCQLPTTSLGIWDYLSDARPVPRETMPAPPYSVLYAGSLGMRKNRFLYQLEHCLHSLSFHLYGNGFEVDKIQHPERFTYHGFVDSDQLIATAQGDFGLVWDGDSVSTCTGNFGEYLRYNNPHKASLYIRCHLPLIVWDESGLAPFVRAHRIGICLHSLEDLEETLSRISPEEYAALYANVVQLSSALGTGSMMRAAIHAPLLTHNK